MLPIRNISYLSPMCCDFFFFFNRKMHKHPQNWSGVQYPLKFCDTSSSLLWPCKLVPTALHFYQDLVLYNLFFMINSKSTIVLLQSTIKVVYLFFTHLFKGKCLSYIDTKHNCSFTKVFIEQSKYNETLGQGEKTLTQGRLSHVHI